MSNQIMGLSWDYSLESVNQAASNGLNCNRSSAEQDVEALDRNRNGPLYNPSTRINFRCRRQRKIPLMRLRI